MRSTRIATLCGALALALTACGPIVMIPGGELSGTVEAPPADWAFSDEVETVQIETRPEDPYSVNVWGVAVGPDFYVGTSPETNWSQHISKDPRVRLRINETLYELKAEVAEGDARRDTFLKALKRKYDYEPDAERSEDWVFYRLVAR